MIATAMSEQTMRMTSNAMTMPRQLRCDGLLPTSSCRNTQHITHVKCHSNTKYTALSEPCDVINACTLSLKAMLQDVQAFVLAEHVWSRRICDTGC